jgi:8-hydroxy-5-deazaflavin:NADPH oxidoreductase
VTTAIIGTGGIGSVVAGRLAAGGETLRLASADGDSARALAAQPGHRAPEPAVLFYAADADRAGQEAERLIRTAGFEPVKAGGLSQSGRVEVGGDLHDVVVGPAVARSLVSRA